MNLSDFFEKLDLSDIKQFVDGKRQEDLFLDFKTVSENPFNSDDRRNFAKALSGFANSSGGIIVWGIDARKNQDGVDCASSLKPIKNILKFLSQLNSFTGEFVNPLVDGVQHKIFELDNSAASGFAISLIPKSEIGPHMAMSEEHRYYKRSGDSFYKLEHHDLEDMFGRRPLPVLELTVRVEGSNPDNLKIILGIQNTGKGIAKFPFLSITMNSPYRVFTYGLDGNGHHGLPFVIQEGESNQKKNFGGSFDKVIYPKTSYAVTAITLNEPLIKPTIQEVPNLQIDYLLACEGIEPKQGQMSISSKEIIGQLKTSN